MEVDGAFWRGRRVLVTGHTGFKGGWLALWLDSLGADVAGLALAPAEPCFFQAASLGRRMRSVIGDIREPETVDRTMRENSPEIVFHLAAQSLVRTSYRDPVGTYATNVLGTVHVLDAARRTQSVRAVVVVTSDKCYENMEQPKGYRETDRLGGHDPYSSSKACAELVAAAYRRSFFSSQAGRTPCAIATARAGNVIGGGDWCDDRLIPDIVRALSRNEGPTVRNPSAVRPWQHVLEPLCGYLMLAERLAGGDARRYADAWNFGPRDDDARDVRWITERFLEFWGKARTWRQPEEGGQPHETQMLKLDASKARTHLGWEPVMDVEEALRDTVSWYRNHVAGKDMLQFSLAQIGAYTERARCVESRSGVPGA